MSTTIFWHSSTTYSGGSGLYNGNVTTSNIANSSNMTGEWIQIKLPYKLLVKSVGLLCRSGYQTRMPSSMAILGSNNGTNWNIIFQQSTTDAYTDGVVKTITINTATVPYSHIRLIARTTITGGDTININQLNYKGDIYA